MLSNIPVKWNIFLLHLLLQSIILGRISQCHVALISHHIHTYLCTIIFHDHESSIFTTKCPPNWTDIDEILISSRRPNRSHGKYNRFGKQFYCSLWCITLKQTSLYAINSKSIETLHPNYVIDQRFLLLIFTPCLHQCIEFFQLSCPKKTALKRRIIPMCNWKQYE